VNKNIILSSLIFFLLKKKKCSAPFAKRSNKKIEITNFRIWLHLNVGCLGPPSLVFTQSNVFGRLFRCCSTRTIYNIAPTTGQQKVRLNFASAHNGPTLSWRNDRLNQHPSRSLNIHLCTCARVHYKYGDDNIVVGCCVSLFIHACVCLWEKLSQKTDPSP